MFYQSVKLKETTLEDKNLEDVTKSKFKENE